MRFTVAREIFSGWSLVIVVLLPHNSLRAQPNRPVAVTTVAQLLALCNDPKTIVDTTKVNQVLKSLGPEDLKNTERQLVVCPNAEIAIMAAYGRIGAHDTDSAALIASHISEWPKSQTGLLQQIAKDREPFMEVPRGLVRSTIKSGKVVEPPDSPLEPVGMAAILLAKTGNPADRQMLLDLAQWRPKSWGVWLAIAYAGAMDVAHAKLAYPVYQDTNAPIAARVAAAAALEPFDAQALAFATTQIQSYLTQYADQDMVRFLAQSTLDWRHGPNEANRTWHQYQSTFHLLAALIVLKADAAQQLTFRYLNARDWYTRNLCANEAALRWPDRLMKTGQGSLNDREYGDLLAFIAQRHPEQAGAAAVQITPDRMAKAKAEVATIGLGTLDFPGNILRIF